MPGFFSWLFGNDEDSEYYIDDDGSDSTYNGEEDVERVGWYQDNPDGTRNYGHSQEWMSPKEARAIQKAHRSEGRHAVRQRAR